MLSKTRSRIRILAKEVLFDRLKLKEVGDVRNQRALEESMGFPGQWDEHRRFQLDLLKREGVLSHHKFLEIGCGPLTAGIPLIEYLDSGKYVGVDVRPGVLNLAYEQLGKVGLSEKNPRLICSETFGRDFLGSAKFPFILAFSVLYHLSDDKLEGFFRMISNHLQEEGRCIANVNTCTPPSTWLEFPFIMRPVSYYSQIANHYHLCTEDLGEMGDQGFALKAEEGKNRILRFSVAH